MSKNKYEIQIENASKTYLALKKFEKKCKNQGFGRIFGNHLKPIPNLQIHSK